jgi:hypothetical protein
LPRYEMRDDANCMKALEKRKRNRHATSGCAESWRNLNLSQPRGKDIGARRSICPVF